MTYRFVFMPSFEKSIKQLKKKYPRVPQDIEIALENLEKLPSAGDIIPRDYDVRKLRVASQDMQRGKSSGFRVLYKIEDTMDLIYLLLIYAKTEREDIGFRELNQLVEALPSANEIPQNEEESSDEG